MKKYFLSIAIALLYTASFAQDNGTYTFSLQQCIDYANEHQASILNAKLEEQVAHHKVQELLGIGLPQINAQADVNHWLEKPTALVPAENFGGPSGVYVPFQFNLVDNGQAGISASQLLFDGSYFIGLKASKTFEVLASKQTTNTKIDIAVNVSKAYYGVLVGDARLGSLTSNIDRLQKSYEDTKAAFEQGFVEKIDMQRLEVALNNLKTEKNRATRLTDLSIYLLKFQMGMEQSANLILTDKITDLQVPKADNLPDTLDYTNRIEMQIIQTQKVLQQYNVKRFKAAYLPQLVAYGSLGTTTNSEEFDIFKSTKSWYWNSQVGLKLSVPIFSGGQRYHKVKAEEANLFKIDNGIENTNQALILQYNSAKSTFINAYASFEIEKKNRELAAEIVRVTKIKFQEGVGSNLEVVDAESQLRQAESTFYTVVYEALIAKVDLDKAMGLIK